MPRKDGTPWEPGPTNPAWNPDRQLTDEDYERISKGYEPRGAKPPVPFGKHSPETLAMWAERAAETRAVKRSIKALVNREEFEKAHREEAALLLDSKIQFVRGLIAQAMDDEGEVSTKLIKQMDAKDKALILKAYEQIEKVGHQKVTTTKHEHTHSLADQFKALQQKGRDDIEGSVVE